jgi:hypothetical protein
VFWRAEQERVSSSSPFNRTIGLTQLLPGIWALKLAEQVPSSVQIQGIDITSKLFPANHPTNLHFSINSITSLPGSWTSSFAFVHQRFLVGALTGDTWKTAISKMSRVVMAGGWIELVEMTGDFPQVGPHSTKVTLLFGGIMRDKQFLFHCPIQVPAMLQQAGFVNVRSECRMVPLGRSAGQDGIDGSTNLAALTDAVKTPILRAAGYGHVHSEAEYDAMVSGAKEEWLSSDVEFPFYTIYAQKPA